MVLEQDGAISGGLLIIYVDGCLSKVQQHQRFFEAYLTGGVVRWPDGVLMQPRIRLLCATRAGTEGRSCWYCLESLRERRCALLGGAAANRRDQQRAKCHEQHDATPCGHRERLIEAAIFLQQDVTGRVGPEPHRHAIADGRWVVEFGAGDRLPDLLARPIIVAHAHAERFRGAIATPMRRSKPLGTLPSVTPDWHGSSASMTPLVCWPKKISALWPTTIGTTGDPKTQAQQPPQLQMTIRGIRRKSSAGLRLR
jgi:hypothetical protein